MKKVSFNFLNRFERFILRNRTDEYVPVSSTIALSTIAAAVVGMIIAFLTQMGGDESLGPIFLGIAFGAAFLFCCYKTYKSIMLIPTTKGKIGLIAYGLVLFVICSVIFFFVVMWALIIAVLGALAILILKLTLGSSGSKKGRVYYRDGSSEEVVQDGKGITGETYYKSESGRTFVD